MADVSLKEKRLNHAIRRITEKVASDEYGHFKGTIENGIITDFKWEVSYDEFKKK